MSSALDITYKTLTPKAGQKTMAEATVAASLLGADAYVGFATKRFSWLNSVRYKTNRYLWEAWIPMVNTGPTFWITRLT